MIQKKVDTILNIIQNVLFKDTYREFNNNQIID